MSATHTNETDELRARVSELERHLAEAQSNQASFEAELAERNGELAKAEEKAAAANKRVKQLEEMIDAPMDKVAETMEKADRCDKAEKERDFIIDWIGEQYSEGDKHLVEMALRGEDMGTEIPSVTRLRAVGTEGVDLHAIVIDLARSFAEHTHEYEQPDGVGETRKPMVASMLGGTLKLPFINTLNKGKSKPSGFLYHEEDDGGLFVFGKENRLKMQIGQEKTGFVIYPGKNCIVQVDGLNRCEHIKPPVMNYPGTLNRCAVAEMAAAMGEIVNLLFVRNWSYEEHRSDRYDEIVGIAKQFKPKDAGKKGVGVEKAE